MARKKKSKFDADIAIGLDLGVLRVDPKINNKPVKTSVRGAGRKIRRGIKKIKLWRL